MNLRPRKNSSKFYKCFSKFIFINVPETNNCSFKITENNDQKNDKWEKIRPGIFNTQVLLSKFKINIDECFFECSQ